MAAAAAAQTPAASIAPISLAAAAAEAISPRRLRGAPSSR